VKQFIVAKKKNERRNEGKKVYISSNKRLYIYAAIFLAREKADI
jgi:hypothetical protein